MSLLLSSLSIIVSIEIKIFQSEFQFFSKSVLGKKEFRELSTNIERFLFDVSTIYNWNRYQTRENFTKRLIVSFIKKNFHMNGDEKDVERNLQRIPK